MNCCSRADQLLRWNSNLLQKAKIMTGFPKPWGFTVFPWLQGSVVATGFGSNATSYHGDWGLWQGVKSVVLNRGYCGNSVTGLFCLRVSMRDRTPFFTLVETRRDTESPGGDEPQAFWEGGRATKHFWYRSIQAACTASDTFPALGSHQKT